jgi:hypothetical protein
VGLEVFGVLDKDFGVDDGCERLGSEVSTILTVSEAL